MGNQIRVPANGPFIAEKFTEFVISILSGNISIDNTDDLFQEINDWKEKSTLSIDFSDVIDKVVNVTGFQNNMNDFTVSSDTKLIENIHSIFFGRTFKATYTNINLNVSQVHAFMCIIDNKIIVIDLDSRNGTKVTINNSRIYDGIFYHIIELNSDNVDIKIDTCNGIPLCHILTQEKKITIF